jgi:predicted MFS family arabinose efflux permease
MSADTRARALPTVLIFVVAVTAIISSLGAPLIPSISDDLGVSLSAAQWSLTATLLIGVISSPVMGRLGDGPRRRETIVGGLAVVTAGSILAALAGSLPVLVAGRAMQGIGLGLLPLAMATAREELPDEQAVSVIAVLSVTGATGIGIGYPLSGLLAEIDLSAAFWFGALVSALGLVIAFFFIPSTKGKPQAGVDLHGAALLTAGLASLLIAIAEGSSWGWGSTTTLGLFVAAVVLLFVWAVQQLRSAEPLVDLRIARNRRVLTGYICVMVAGMAMYMYLSAVSEYVQTPKSTGYGFGASVVVAGLCLVPFSATTLVGSRALGFSARLVGRRNVLPLGSLLVAASGLIFALLDQHLWGSFAMMAVFGLGCGITFGAIAGMIVRAVPESQTGSATGFYQVVRYIGFSVGSALAASVLASETPAGSQLPRQAGFTTIAWIGIGICIASAILGWVVPGRGDGPEREPDAAERRREEEEAELASAGLPGVGSK